MGLLELLGGKLVGLDTAPIIYLIEEHPKYLPLVRPVFEAVRRGEVRFVTSTVTLLEVLVQPLRQGRVELAEQYRTILTMAANVAIVPVSIG